MTLHPIECGNFKLDGGAMFGVVPQSIWSRTNPPDSTNKIDLATRALLIEDDDKLILIDCGLGTKQSEKFYGFYDLWGSYTLETSLNQAGFHPNDITDVFLTHLHFDHCGGAIKQENGLLVPMFKNATYWSNQKHWEWATQPNPREKASFLSENIAPIQESGQLQFVDASHKHLESSPLGFEILFMDGHTEKQMLPLITYKGHKIVFAADLIPTVGHIPLVYVMGYDTRPLLTMEEKKQFLDQAVENNWLLYFEHDAHNNLASLKQTEKGVRLAKSLKFSELFSG